jgi:hypothetical protein
MCFRIGIGGRVLGVSLLSEGMLACKEGLTTKQVCVVVMFCFSSPFTFQRATDMLKKSALNDTIKQTKKQTPWSESASELYRPSDRRLSAK